MEQLISNMPDIRVSVGLTCANKSGWRYYFKKIESALPLQRSETVNLVWIHDFYHYHKHLMESAEQLVRGNPRVKIFLIDLYGYGLSGSSKKGKVHFANHQSEVNALIHDEIGDLPTVVIGQGLGASLALDAILCGDLKSIKGAIIANPLIDNRNCLVATWKKRVTKIYSKCLSPFLKQSEIDLNRVGLSSEMISALLNDPLATTSVPKTMVKGLSLSARKIKDSAYFLDRPILFLSGLNNQITSSESCEIFSKMFPREQVTYVAFEELGHDLFLGENFNKTLPVINRWLQRVNEQENLC